MKFMYIKVIKITVTLEGVLDSGSELDKCGILPILDIVCNTGKSSIIAFTLFFEHKQLKLEL